jgi:CO/xanthine dehydrogenase FAD-binding subunit
MLREVETVFKGSEPSPDMVESAGETAFKAAEGVVVENACTSREYRVKMARVITRRAVREALGL